jgi:cell division protein FtsL
VTARKKQAFRQTPWRVQLKVTGRIVQVTVVLLVVAGLYLAVNARLADAGRQVLVLEEQSELSQRTNAELTAQYAEQNNPERMLERAESLGYKPAEPDEIFYLQVEGYVPPPAFVAPRPPTSRLEGATRLSPAYTETLGEWMTRWLTPD